MLHKEVKNVDTAHTKNNEVLLRQNESNNKATNKFAFLSNSKDAIIESLMHIKKGLNNSQSLFLFTQMVDLSHSALALTLMPNTLIEENGWAPLVKNVVTNPGLQNAISLALAGITVASLIVGSNVLNLVKTKLHTTELKFGDMLLYALTAIDVGVIAHNIALLSSISSR